MSSGNLNTYGGKKNNFPFQQNLLLINSAISAAAAAGAKEATLQLVLTALQNGQDYEAKLVRDSDAPPVNWLEVRIFNQTTGVFDPPVYYLAGSNTVGSPVLPIVYIDPTTLLSTIASNTTGLATQATAASIDGKFNSLGQKASAASAPFVLSTEQEALLVAIDAVLDTIKVDTGNILTDTNAMVVDLAAMEILITAGNALLTAIDGKLIDGYGAAAGALRTAAQIGNTAGQADFNVGAPTAQTLRVALANPDTGAPQVVTSVVASDSSGSPLAAGATAIGFTTDTLFVGTINGVAREASTFYGFEAAPGKTLPAIAYTVTAGTMVIDKIV